MGIDGTRKGSSSHRNITKPATIIGGACKKAQKVHLKYNKNMKTKGRKERRNLNIFKSRN